MTPERDENQKSSDAILKEKARILRERVEVRITGELAEEEKRHLETVGEIKGNRLGYQIDALVGLIEENVGYFPLGMVMELGFARRTHLGGTWYYASHRFSRATGQEFKAGSHNVPVVEGYGPERFAERTVEEILGHLAWGIHQGVRYPRELARGHFFFNYFPSGHFPTAFRVVESSNLKGAVRKLGRELAQEGVMEINGLSVHYGDRFSDLRSVVKGQVCNLLSPTFLTQQMGVVKIDEKVLKTFLGYES